MVGIMDKLKGKNGNNTQIQGYRPNVSDGDYFVHPKLKRKFTGLIQVIENIKEFGTEMGHRNYIFAGPPGTGKTLGVEYVATELGAILYDGKTLQNAAHISAAFQEFRKYAKQSKVLVVINELDKFSNREDVTDPNQALLLNTLLDEMNGSESNHNIFIIGTTNRPNAIDSALRRNKRFGKEIEFLPPDRDGRYEILKINAINYRAGEKKGGVLGIGAKKVGGELAAYDSKEAIKERDNGGKPNEETKGMVSIPFLSRKKPTQQKSPEKAVLDVIDPREQAKTIMGDQSDDNGSNVEEGEGLEDISQMHLDPTKKYGHKFDINEDQLADMADVTYGYTGADLVALLNEIFENTLMYNRRIVEQKDIDYGLLNTKPSAIKDMPFKEPKIKFGDLGGYENHTRLLKTIVQNNMIEEEEGTTIMFYGPKGTGKTYFAEALAGEYGYNLIVVNGSAPEDKWVGETGKKLDKYIQRAKQLAPCVLLFDEIDSLVEKKGIMSHKGSWTGLLQSKLSDPIPGVVTIGTVNDIYKITDTFRDRFIYKMFFGMPTEKDLVKVWEKHLTNGVKAEEVASINTKLSCRDIAHCNRMINGWGIKPSIEVYKKIVKNRKNPDNTKWDEMVNDYGDSVQDFENIMEFMEEEEK
ncbi:AAA family ATPase [Nanoarchaeota archaeon]